MLRAFGYKFLDEKGEDVGEGGQALARIASVEISDKKELLSQCNFRIACDVTNPLCGSQGATYIYGPQKGVTPDILPVLDAGMKNYAEVTAKVIGKDNQNAAGVGAAGGLVFSLAVIILLYHLKFLNIAISANKNLLCRHIKSISYLLQKIFYEK